MSASNRPPNIVIFVADDLGMADLGCFGNTTLRTPNIDSIAKQGATLTQHIAAASVCTPSRAALMTGRYPIRMGMVPTNVVRVNLFVAATNGLPPEEKTFAEMVKEQGYKTGYVGKWHLGLHSSNSRDFAHHPMNQGFDSFYGLPLTNLKDFGSDGESVVSTRVPRIYQYLTAIFFGAFMWLLFLHSKKHSSFVLKALLVLVLFLVPVVWWICSNFKVINSILMRDFEVVEQPIQLFNNLTQKFTQESVEFLEQRALDKSPFLLAIPWVQVHTYLHTAPEFEGKSAHGKYGDNVEELDWSVGQVLDALQTLGMKENTFVYFSSDNGGHEDERDLHGNVCGGYTGIYKGGKSQGGMEGGIRVPTVAMYPGVIPPGLVIGTPTSNMDVMPTIAELTGGALPTDRQVDGKSLMPLLKGTSKESTHEFLYHYCGVDIHALRYAPTGSKDVWKFHLATPIWEPGTQGCGFICDCYDPYFSGIYGKALDWHDPPLMYNLAEDPSEDIPLDASEPKYAAIWNYAKQKLQEHRATIEKSPNMFSIPNLLPRPWLQPCCNFPYCSCEDEKYKRK